MKIQTQKTTMAAQKKCKKCVYLQNLGGTLYCPFAGCMQTKRERHKKQ